MLQNSTRIRTRPFLLLMAALMVTGITGPRCKKFEVSRRVILGTGQVSQVTQTSCTITGNLMDLKDQTWPSHGFHWATSMDAILPGDTVNLGRVADAREISSTIRRFEPGRRYFIWTYVNDGTGEIRSEPVEFTTMPAEIPAVSTGEVQVTGPTTAECQYQVSWDGGSPVTQRGLCYGTGPSPTIDGLHTEEGGGTGEYTGTMTGLQPSTEYRVRAYALNAIGIAYGETRTFSTPVGGNLPEVVTLPVENAGPDWASLAGEISSDGGLAITEKGVCWGPDPEPTVDGNKLPMGSGTAPFEDMLDGLTPDTPYFIRAYAINAAGTGYGDNEGFRTRTADLEDSRNGKVYPTVRIGDQVWMAANLDVGEKINGSLDGSDDEVIQKYCYQNNDAYCAQFGALYSWEEMLQYDLTESSQGVCPEGWHIPSDEEWKVLELHLGMDETDAQGEGWRGTDQGGKLKAPGTEIWDDPNTGATNESGFSALPAGGMDNTGYFSGQGYFTDFWTSSWDGTNPWYRYLNAESGGIQRLMGNKGFATSVRCIRD